MELVKANRTNTLNRILQNIDRVLTYVNYLYPFNWAFLTYRTYQSKVLFENPTRTGITIIISDNKRTETIDHKLY